MNTPGLSIIVPTHDTRELTLRCLDSLSAGGVEAVEVVVVDDASSDGTASAVRSAHPDVEVVATGRPQGFSGAANLGAGHAHGELLLFLNSDTEVMEGSLAALVAAFGDDRELGIAGGELFDPDGKPQWRAGRLPKPMWFFLQASGVGAWLARMPGRRVVGRTGAAAVGEVEWVSGAAMTVRREVWKSSGPFDTGYAFYCQDLDLCTAARAAGWRVAVVPGFGVLHHHGASIGAAPGAATSAFHPARMWTDLVRYVSKHRGEAAARRAAGALRAGARLRLLGRAVGGLFAGDRDSWRRDTAAYRAGLEALG